MKYDPQYKEQYEQVFMKHLRNSGMVIVHVNKRTQAILDVFEEVIGREGTWDMLNEAVEELVPNFIASLEQLKLDEWEKQAEAFKAALATPKT